MNDYLIVNFESRRYKSKYYKGNAKEQIKKYHFLNSSGTNTPMSHWTFNDIRFNEVLLKFEYHFSCDGSHMWYIESKLIPVKKKVFLI